MGQAEVGHLHQPVATAVILDLVLVHQALELGVQLFRTLLCLADGVQVTEESLRFTAVQVALDGAAQAVDDTICVVTQQVGELLDDFRVELPRGYLFDDLTQAAGQFADAAAVLEQVRPALGQAVVSHGLQNGLLHA